MSDGPRTCSTCGNPYDPENIAETHPYRHPVNGSIFNTKKTEMDQQEPGLLDKVKSLPSDPLLRFALIQAGVITPEQLEQAELVLAATGMAVTGPQIRREARSTDDRADTPGEGNPSVQASSDRRRSIRCERCNRWPSECMCPKSKVPLHLETFDDEGNPIDPETQPSSGTRPEGSCCEAEAHAPEAMVSDMSSAEPRPLYSEVPGEAIMDAWGGFAQSDGSDPQRRLEQPPLPYHDLS